MATAREAVQRARSKSEPTLLECRTYRWRGHVGASWDMDVGVKRKDELKVWMEQDPVARLSAVLVERGISPKTIADIERVVSVEIAEAVDFARRSPYPGEGSISENVYWSPAEIQ